MRDPKGPVKPYRSPEEVAKRHKVPLEKIIKQVKMGTKVEGEHTTSKSGARITALQHVDELPDYYSKLKKVEKIKEGNLHQWFSGSKDKSGKPGWVNVVTGDSCASDKPGEGVPKCVSSSKRASMTPAERRSAAARKRAADPGQQEKTGAAKPTYVSTDKKKKMKEEFVSEEDKKGKGSGKKDACYHKVKARFKVWPSAYASGALVKCRKAGAANWGNKSEEVSVEQQYEKDTKYCLLCRKNETRAECSYGPTMWDRYSIAKIHPANESKIHEDHKEVASGKKKDEEGYMANIEFDQIERAVNILRSRIKKGDQQIPAWVQSKITRAADFIDTAADYMASDEEVSEGMDMKAFKAQRSKVKRSEKRAADKIAPGRRAGIHSDRLSPERAARHRANVDPDFEGNDERNYPGGKLRAKKVRKAKALGELGEACWTGYKQVGMKKKGKKMVPNCVPANEDTCKTFSQFMQIAEANKKVKISTNKPIEYKIADIGPGGKEHNVKTSKGWKDIKEVAAWQRSEGKNKSGGLNEKGRKSYERENPGSDLKAPSKKVGNPRRASFCARMKGMKSKLTSKKTASDPNSRINKSLRAWNC